MNLQASDRPGIASHFTRLLAALLEHLLALSSLAACEAKQGARQILLSFLLLFFALLLGVIGYLLLLAILIVVATALWQFTLLLTLSLIALGHFLMAGVLFFYFSRNRKIALFRLTQRELLRDLTTLDHHHLFQ
jgi:hypothetical protein